MAKRMKIDPYYQRHKCSPMTSFGNIRRMRIFVGVPLGLGHRMTVGLSTTAILAIWVATSSETSKIRPPILHGDMLPLVGR